MRVSHRFSLRGLLHLSTLSMIGISVGFHLRDAESPVEHEIRIHGSTPVPDLAALLNKAWRRAELGAMVDQGLSIRDEEVPVLSRVEYAQLAVYYRKLYPLKSLRDRLLYEQPIKASSARLSQETMIRLTHLEDPTRGGSIKWVEWPVRSRALRALHSDDVFRLLSQDGAGYGRFATPSIRHFQVEQTERIPFDSIPSDSFDAGPIVSLPEMDRTASDFEPHCSERVSFRENLHRTRKAYLDWARIWNPMLMPSRQRLHRIHETDRLSFAEGERNGYVVNLDRVAGFRGHALAKLPELRVREPQQMRYGSHYQQTVDARGKKRYMIANAVNPPRDRLWKLRSLQLISVNKHDVPKAYAMKSLPNMEHTSQAPMRDLDPFESRSMKRLEAGEDVVIQSHRNRVRMVGSMRTLVQCQSCHQTERGNLLGAFTYDFVRTESNAPSGARPFVDHAGADYLASSR